MVNRNELSSSILSLLLIAWSSKRTLISPVRNEQFRPTPTGRSTDESAEQVEQKRPRAYSEFGWICIVWYGNIQFNVIRRWSSLELRFTLWTREFAISLQKREMEQRPMAHLDDIFDPTSRMLFNHSFRPNQRFHLSVQPITHQLELSIWWNERNRPIVLESR